MELQAALEKRVSIRGTYTGAKVEREKIEEMLKAAQLAPSWKNSRTSRYYIAMGAEAYAKVRAALPEFNKNNTEGAAALIVTTVVKNRAGFDRDGNPDNELGNGWGCYDCGLQAMAMLLKASELGLSTLIMGIRDEKALRAALDIPETEMVIGVTAVGVSEAEPIRPKRKDLNDIAKFF